MEGQSHCKHGCINTKQNVWKENEPMDMGEKVILCVGLISALLGWFSSRTQKIYSPP